MVKLIYIFLLLNFLLPSNTLDYFPPDNHNSWILLKKDKIRVKYSKDFQVPWCRASANFRFSKEEIYAALKNLNNYKNIFDRVTHSKILDKDDGIVYIRLDMPYVFADRDYTVKFIESRKENEIVFRFYSVVHPRTPNTRGSVTLPRAAGEWRLIPVDENSTRVVYTWNGELLGNFPNSSLKTAWVTQGTEVLIWLNEYLKKNQGD